MVECASYHQNNIMIVFPDPKNPQKEVSCVILSHIVFKLALIFATNGGHIGFCQYGGPIGHPSWQSAEIEIIWHGHHLGQIWYFWNDLNQIIPKGPDQIYMDVGSNICLGELLVGHWISISSLSFGILCTVVTFQRVKKVSPESVNEKHLSGDTFFTNLVTSCIYHIKSSVLLPKFA